MSTLDPAGVAELLKKPENWFKRKWRELNKLAGFPAPLPGVGLRWSTRQVEAWIAAGGAPITVEVERPPSVVEEARAALASRYAA